MDGYRLTVKLSDSGVGVGFCGVVAGSGYQEFGAEVVRSVDHEVVSSENLCRVVGSEPERVEVEPDIGIKVEKALFCRGYLEFSD